MSGNDFLTPTGQTDRPDGGVKSGVKTSNTGLGDLKTLPFTPLILDCEGSSFTIHHNPKKPEHERPRVTLYIGM